MLSEVSKEVYKNSFTTDPNPFISIHFIGINCRKVDRIVMLVNKTEKPSIGMVGGIKNNVLKCPFFAPFGGFHFRSENLHYSEVFDFISDLIKYLKENNLDRMELILPPDIYSQTFNSKVINALIRNKYEMLIPDITSVGDLNRFSGEFTDPKCRKFFRQAERNGLSFLIAESSKEKEEAYNIIRQNRIWLNRPIHMPFTEVEEVSTIWPVDYFLIKNSYNESMASAILYRAHQKIVQLIWWGDNETGRQLRSMDFLANKLWTHYKNIGFEYIDMGISTEDGIPNTGLLRFKETLDAYSSLKFRFVWSSE